MATKAQRAAARKNIKKAQAALRAKRRGKKTVRRAHRQSRAQHAASMKNLRKARAGKRRKKVCRRAAGRRGAAKVHRKSMPRMPKMCRPKRRKGRRKNPLALLANPRRKRRTTKGKHCVRWERGKKRRHGKKHEMHRRRRKAAARKAAATRARHRRERQDREDYERGGYGFEANPVRRRRRRHGRRRNPVHHRHHRAHRHHKHPFMRRYNPIGNPIGSATEFLSALFGVGLGYAVASALDRALATHPLTANTAGTGYLDTPAAGQLFDSEAPLLPLWQNPMRLVAAAAVIFVPGILSRYFQGAEAKSFFQLTSYGAAARTGGKLIEDTIATTLSSQQFALQLYGPEIAAQNRLATANGAAPVPMTQGTTGGTSTGATAGTFAGAPKNALPAAPAKQLAPRATGVGDCTPPCPPTPITTDPLQSVQNAMDGSQPNFYTDSFPFNLDNYNPMDPMGQGPECLPLPMQQQPSGPSLNDLPGGQLPTVVPTTTVPAPPAPPIVTQAPPPPSPPVVSTPAPPVVPVQAPAAPCAPGQIVDNGRCVTPHQAPSNIPLTSSATQPYIPR